MATSYKKIIVKKDSEDNRLVWIKLNYSERLNVLHLEMLKELYDALVNVDRDETVQAILITGVGKTFCAGADVKELMESGFEQGVRWYQAYWKVLELIRETGKPVVAAVKGACVAGGHELMMICDLVVAGKSARLGQPEVIVGSTALGSGAQLLPLIVGEKRAREMLFTGKLLSADEAYEVGLVNRVVADEDVEAEARKLAQKIIDNASPQAFRVIKSGLKFWTNLAMLNMQTARDITSMVWASRNLGKGAETFWTRRR
ncbi:MAG: 3-hydroxypropionyl-coenzyme A dehydratase [Candidatus Bathyarchaeota archaeon BA2]|nr:MAG: 3-hydroxypropionyl-coenzyme A dehydratase [Candidatus Bathyarchaeota archaeon BA2]